MSDAVWLAIIGLVAVVVKEILDERRSRRSESKVEEVAAKVEVVRHATNSLTEQLVEKAGVAGEHKGAEEERARASARTKDADDGGSERRPAANIREQITEVKDKVKEVKDVADDIKEAVVPDAEKQGK